MQVEILKFKESDIIVCCAFIESERVLLVEKNKTETPKEVTHTITLTSDTDSQKKNTVPKKNSAEFEVNCPMLHCTVMSSSSL